MNKTQKMVAPELDWEESHSGNTQTATLEKDGFTVVVKVKPDYDYDWTDCRGKFTSTYQYGAIRNPESVYDRHAYKWFIPCTSVEKHRESLQKMGYARGVAEEMARGYVQEDMHICIDPDKAGYYAVYMTCTASYKNVVLGTDSLGGIELSYKDKTTLNECAQQLIDNAVQEAKEKLADIRALA